MNEVNKDDTMDINNVTQAGYVFWYSFYRLFFIFKAILSSVCMDPLVYKRLPGSVNQLILYAKQSLSPYAVFVVPVMYT